MRLAQQKKLTYQEALRLISSKYKADFDLYAPAVRQKELQRAYLRAVDYDIDTTELIKQLGSAVNEEDPGKIDAKRHNLPLNRTYDALIGVISALMRAFTRDSAVLSFQQRAIVLKDILVTLLMIALDFSRTGNDTRMIRNIRDFVAHVVHPSFLIQTVPDADGTTEIGVEDQPYSSYYSTHRQIVRTVQHLTEAGVGRDTPGVGLTDGPCIPWNTVLPGDNTSEGCTDTSKYHEDNRHVCPLHRTSKHRLVNCPIIRRNLAPANFNPNPNVDPLLAVRRGTQSSRGRGGQRGRGTRGGRSKGTRGGRGRGRGRGQK